MKRCAVLLLTLIGLTGCNASYTLRGVVVQSDYADARFVESAQSIDEPGLSGASIQLYRDPSRPSRARVASGRSGSDGSFSFPVDAFGAGWMEEQWEIEVVRAGFETFRMMISLPPARAERRLVLSLRPGVSIPPKPAEDLWGDYERFK